MHVLLVRAGALGDVLLLRRAVFALRRAGHRVSLLAPAVGRVLVGNGLSEVDEAWPWDGPDVARLLAGDAAPSPVIASLQAAGTVVAYTRSESVIAALRSATRRVIAHDPAPPPAGPHASHWLVGPLRALDAEGMGDREPVPALTAPHVPVADPPPLSFSPAERAAAKPFLKQLPARFLAIHPGSGSPKKNWPPDRFAALADRLAPDQPALLALGPAEDAIAETLLQAHAGRWVLARELPPRVLGAVLSQAGLFVGNDSGASHLAAAAGAPTLALFGPTDPALWAPVGRAVRFLRATSHRASDLHLDDVIRGAALLAPARIARP